MSEKNLYRLGFALGVAGYVGVNVLAARKTRKAEQAERTDIVNQMGVEVAAIHRATDIVNGRIERGEIRSYDQLREAVLTEVGFQKILINENLS